MPLPAKKSNIKLVVDNTFSPLSILPKKIIYVSCNSATQARDISLLKEKYDVIIIGAGAAGMMSAIEAGNRGRKVLLVDHAKKIGEKIRISGGGRCNFTNINTHPNKFISN